MDWGAGITHFAETTVKEKKVVFGIKDMDRLEHVCIIGRAGSHRSDLLVRMILEDMKRGVGTLVLDTSGKITQMVIERISPDAKDRLVYLDPADGEYPFSWNPMDDFRSLSIEIAIPLLSKTLASVYEIPASALTELSATAILAKEQSTLLLLYELLNDEETRKKQFADMPDVAEQFEGAITNNADAVERVKEHGRYIAKDSLVRNLIGQPTSKFTLAKLSEGAIFIVDLTRIKMFPTRVTPLVRLMLHTIEARAHGSQDPVALYLSECLRYLGDDDVELLFKKHAVLTTISDTFYGDEQKELRDKTVSRAGSVIAFTPNQGDVETIERVFYPYITADELEKIEEGEFIVALAIDAVRSRPFFAQVLPLPERTGLSDQDLMSKSRDLYTTSRMKIDAIFKKVIPPNIPPRPEPKPPEASGFSDAFRSIFAKQAPGDAPVKAGSPVPPPQRPKEQVQKGGFDEVPEGELRSLLDVVPPEDSE